MLVQLSKNQLLSIMHWAAILPGLQDATHQAFSWHTKMSYILEWRLSDDTCNVICNLLPLAAQLEGILTLPDFLCCKIVYEISNSWASKHT